MNFKKLFLLLLLPISQKYVCTDTTEQSNQTSLEQTEKVSNDNTSENTYKSWISTITEYTKIIAPIIATASVIGISAIIYQRYKAFNDPQQVLNRWINNMKVKYPQVDIFDKATYIASNKAWSVYIKKSQINCPIENITKGLNSNDEASLLHELGHIQNRIDYPFIPSFFPRFHNILKIETARVMLMLLGNKFSRKYCKPTIMKILGPYAALLSIYKFDERNADNFACKHANKQALLDQSNYYTNLAKKVIDKELKNNPEFQSFPDHKIETIRQIAYKLESLLRNYIYPLIDEHPSDQSRARKFAQAAANK